MGPGTRGGNRLPTGSPPTTHSGRQCLLCPVRLDQLPVLGGTVRSLFPRGGSSKWTRGQRKLCCGSTGQEARGFLLSIQAPTGSMSCLPVRGTENGLRICHRLTRCGPRACELRGSTVGGRGASRGAVERRGGLDRAAWGMGSLGTIHVAGPGLVPPSPMVS